MSATLYTGTELSATTPEVWDKAVEEARYEKSVMVPLVSNKSALVADAGDIIHVPVGKKRVVQTISLTDGAFTPASLTPDDVQITVNQWLTVSEKITDAAKKQSYYDPQSDFGKSVLKALMAKYDAQLLSLHTQFTTVPAVGSSDTPKNFGKSYMLAAVLRLSNRDIPKDDMAFALPPDAFYAGIMNEAQMVDANKAGIPKSLLNDGFKGVFNLVGIPAYETSANIHPKIGNTWKGILFHKQAMAIAMQINNKYEQVRLTPTGVLGDLWVTQTLDGFKEVRTDHAVIINILAASESDN